MCRLPLTSAEHTYTHIYTRADSCIELWLQHLCQGAKKRLKAANSSSTWRATECGRGMWKVTRGGGREELVGAVRVRGAAEVQSSCHLRGLAKKKEKLQTNKAAGSKEGVGTGRWEGFADRQWKQLKCANRRLPSDGVWCGRTKGVRRGCLLASVSFRFALLLVWLLVVAFQAAPLTLYTLFPFHPLFPRSLFHTSHRRLAFFSVGCVDVSHFVCMNMKG